jgi:hypothetical protein
VTNNVRRTAVKVTPSNVHWQMALHPSFHHRYLEILKEKDLFLLCRFRTSNHRLSIEIGRWQNINRENRVCNLCQGIRREFGDKYH